MRQHRVVVDVWVAPADVAVPAAVRRVLDPVERARAAALARPASGRFVLGRALLRGAVADHLGCDPREVVLTARCPRCGGPHGPVRVDGPPGTGGTAAEPPPLHVGVTRSGPVVAVALCVAGPVGVDAEASASVGSAPLADVVLSRRERAGRRGACHADLARTWVRKEAALKAVGAGLTVDPSSVTVGRAHWRTRGVHAVVRRAAEGKAEGASAGTPTPVDRAVGAPEPGAPTVVEVALREPVAVADLRLGRGRVGAVAVVVPDLVRPAGRFGARLVVRRYDGASALTALRS